MTFRAKFNADLFLRAFTAAGTEPMRYYLTGVHVEPHPERGVFLVGTNGHYLICMRDEFGVCEGGTAIVKPDAYFLKTVTAENRLSQRNPLERVIGPATIAVSGSRMGVYREGPDSGPADGIFDALETARPPLKAIQVQDAVIDGTYPDWRRVLPRSVENLDSKPIAFNPAYLVAMHKALSSDKGEALSVSPQSDSADGFRSSVVRTMTPKLNGFGVLMCMRFTGETGFPSWLDLPGKKEGEA
jgi:hypothetical protein